MCVATRSIYGYLCKDEQNQFLYCCSNCNLEFSKSTELEAHTSEHTEVQSDQVGAVDGEINSDTENKDEEMPVEAGSSGSTPKLRRKLRNTQKNAGEKSSPKNVESTNQSTTSQQPLRPSQAILLKQKKGIPINSIERIFSCRICSAKFYKHCNLQRHMDIHIENRPTNECDVCGKTVIDLKAHSRTHMNEKKHRCPHCPAAFRTSGSLQDHVRRHNDGSKQLICSFCEVVVFSNRDLTRHIAKCTESVPEDALEDDVENEISNRIKMVSSQMRECVLCGTKVKNLKVHLRSHTHERPYDCSLCDRTFTQSGHRNLHMRQVHNVDPNADTTEQPPVKEYSCEMCCRNFDSMSDLDDHMRIHITPNGLCKICNKVVAPGCITAHLRTHTGKNNQYKCTICPTSFQRKDHLEKHFALHTGIRPYECSICKEAMYTSAALKRHIKSKHPNAPKQIEKTLCSICGKQINTKNIELHMRVHTGERPYRCDLCPSAFAQKTNLDNHMRRHTGQKPYTCEPCQKSFHSACALNSHKRRHDTTKLFKCELCDGAFKTKRSLSNHHDVQHNFKRLHCCQLCSKTFAWESGLRDHMKRHKLLKYRCIECGEKFMLKAEQREHERSVHHLP